MKIDLEELERKAMAAQAVDVAELRRKIEASLSRGREGIHRPVRVPEEIDAHIAANDPLVTPALIAHIRALDQIATRALGEWRAWHAEVSTSDTEGWKATDAEIEAMIQIVAKGAVLP